MSTCSKWQSLFTLLHDTRHTSNLMQSNLYSEYL